MNQSFWKDKKVFITGHTGFKGSWLSLWLEELGANVTGFSLPPPSQPSFFESAKLHDGIKSQLGDVRIYNDLHDAILKSHPEIIFHLAAQSLVRPSYQNPIETYATNVMGTAHLLEASRFVKGIKAIVIVTSDKCYENREWVWGYRENDPMGGFDPYSNSKGCAELVTASFRNSFFHPDHFKQHGVAIASVRAGNVIGGGDWATDRLIPDLIRAFSQNEPVHIRNPNAIRPWQHVLEPLSGYLLLGQKLYEEGPLYAEAWNFGPSDEDAQPVSWIVNKVATLWGNNSKWSIESKENPHEAHYLKLDCSKVKMKLGWKSKWPLSQCLEETVKWYQAFYQKQNIRDFSIQQIRLYCKSRTP